MTGRDEVVIRITTAREGLDPSEYRIPGRAYSDKIVTIPHGGNAAS
jgi:hypothetical protein